MRGRAGVWFLVCIPFLLAAFLVLGTFWEVDADGTPDVLAVLFLATGLSAVVTTSIAMVYSVRAPVRTWHRRTFQGGFITVALGLWSWLMSYNTTHREGRTEDDIGMTVTFAILGITLVLGGFLAMMIAGVAELRAPKAQTL